MTTRKPPAASGGKWVTNIKRLALYMRDNCECVYCGSQHKLTLDHLRPHSKGGTNEARNLITCCLACNTRRGNKPWWEFAASYDGARERIERQRRRSIHRLRKVARQALELANNSVPQALDRAA